MERYVRVWNGKTWFVNIKHRKFVRMKSFPIIIMDASSFTFLAISLFCKFLFFPFSFSLSASSTLKIYFNFCRTIWKIPFKTWSWSTKTKRSNILRCRQRLRQTVEKFYAFLANCGNKVIKCSWKTPGIRLQQCLMVIRWAWACTMTNRILSIKPN